MIRHIALACVAGALAIAPLVLVPARAAAEDRFHPSLHADLGGGAIREGSELITMAARLGAHVWRNLEVQVALDAGFGAEFPTPPLDLGPTVQNVSVLGFGVDLNAVRPGTLEVWAGAGFRLIRAKASVEYGYVPLGCVFVPFAEQCTERATIEDEDTLPAATIAAGVRIGGERVRLGFEARNTFVHRASFDRFGTSVPVGGLGFMVTLGGVLVLPERVVTTEVVEMQPAPRPEPPAEPSAASEPPNAPPDP